LIDDYFKGTNIIIPPNYPGENKYCDIKKLKINSWVSKIIQFEGPCEVIGISQVIGPYTGLVDIDGTIFNNWDRWCYYERNKVNLRFKVRDKTSIKILDDDFDRSLCEHACNWDVPKGLKLNEAFYIGGSLKVEKIQ
jgi:hypothetical protein